VIASAGSGNPFRFSLGSGQSLPCHLSWRIAETITLGIWGPGDLVIPSLIGLEPIELISLSPVQVVASRASLQDERRFLIDQLGQASTLLLLSRVRPVETRLFRLLLWLGGQPVVPGDEPHPSPAGRDCRHDPGDGDQSPQPLPPVRVDGAGGEG